jgi:hypothetical protein
MSQTAVAAEAQGYNQNHEQLQTFERQSQI